METPILCQEQPAEDPAEAARLDELRQLVATTGPLADVRDLAPQVRELFPEPAYAVGCGGCHIWLHRNGENAARLALILVAHR